MKNYYLLLLIIIVSCNGNLNIDGITSDQHKYVPGTNCYLIPPFDHKETRDYKGFQDKSFKWSISIESSPKTLEEFEKIYSKRNLKALRKELQGSKDVNYADKFSGRSYQYVNLRRKLKNNALVIDIGSERIHIKTWVRDDVNSSENEQLVSKALNSLVIVDKSDVTDEMNNPFTVKSDKVFFKERNILGQYIYHMAERKDSFELVIWDNDLKFGVQQYPETPFEFSLGKRYEIIEDITVDKSWIHESKIWYGESKVVGGLKGFVGYNDLGFRKTIQYSITFKDNYKENYEFSKKLIEGIKWYK